MKIEIQKLKISKHLSKTTTAFSAEVWVDGVLTLHASNHGTGGSNNYYKAPGAKVTEAELHAWCKANGRQPIPNWDADIDSVLEELMFVDKVRKSLDRKLKTKVCTLLDGKFYTWKAVAGTPVTLKPGEVVVNGRPDLYDAAMTAMGV